MFKITISLIAVLTLGIVASTASAAVITENFESYTGSPTGTDFPSQASSKWSFSYNNGASNNIVSEGGTHGNVFTLDTTGQSPYVPNFSWYPYNSGEYGSDYANGGVTAFDIRINSPVVGTYDINSFDGPGTTPAVALESNGGTGATLQAISTTSPVLVNLTVGTWYTIWIDETTPNVPGATIEYFVNKNLVATDTDPYLLAGYEPVFGMAGYTGQADNVSFDNIAFSNDGGIVPEPASLSLLGIGGLLMLRRRRAK